jgi:hypothetical protein
LSTGRDAQLGQPAGANDLLALNNFPARWVIFPPNSMQYWRTLFENTALTGAGFDPGIAGRSAPLAWIFSCRFRMEADRIGPCARNGSL